jgi:hypothetical protein
MPCVSVKFNTSMFVEVHSCTCINVNVTGGIDLRKTNVKNQNGRGKARRVHLVLIIRRPIREKDQLLHCDARRVVSGPTTTCFPKFLIFSLFLILFSSALFFSRAPGHHTTPSQVPRRRLPVVSCSPSAASCRTSRSYRDQLSSYLQ